jgi:hypothetical protein
MRLDVFPFVSRQSLRRRFCGRRRHGRRFPVTAWFLVERLEDRSLLSPTVTAPAAISVNGYSTLLFATAQGDGITLADSAAGSNTDSLTLKVNEGTLALGSTTGLSFPSGSNGSGSMTISGTLTNLNAALNRLVYTPNPGYVGTDTLGLTITDSGDSLTGSAGVVITVNPVDPPAVSALKAISVNEDSTLLFTPANGDGITLADSVPGTNDVETLTLTALRGTLALGATTGLTFTAGSDDSNSMTVSGTLANLNAGLNRLVYTPNLNETAPDTLSVSLSDPIDAMTGSANVAITINPVGPPTVTGPTAISVNEDSALVFTPNNQDGITLADSVPGANDLELLSLTANKGTLALGSTTGLTFPAGADDTGGITISGTLTALAAALNRLVYTPNMGYNGPDTLHVSLYDPIDTLTGSATVALTVNPASPPTVSAPAAISVNEYSTLLFATSQGDGITLGDAAAAPVDNEALTLSVSHGTLALGSTSGLTFTVGANDTDFMTINGTLDALDAALNRLVYTPDTPYSGPDTLQLSLNDPGDGLTGTANVAITVSPAPATQLAFVSLPTTGTAGQPLGAVAVELEDAFGNLVANDNSNVTLTADGPGGFAGSSTTTVAATGGIATFSNLVFDTAGSETLIASDPTHRLPVATSTALTINPASAARLVFVTLPPTGTAGLPLGSVAVELQDPFGNLVTSDSSNVTLTAAGPGAFTGTSTTTVAATSGVATFSNLVLDTAGSYTLTASDPADGLPVVTSRTLTIGPAASEQLVFQNVPATGLAGQGYPLTFDVLVEDQFGNVETSDNSDIVQVSIASGPVSVFNVQGATNVMTYSAQAVQGDAHFASAVDLYFATAGVYQLEADNALIAAPATSGSISIEPLPVVNAPTAVSVNENSVFTFSSGNKFSVTDLAGGPNTNETLTLNVSNGTVSLAAPSGLTVAGSGTAASPLTVSGSLANLNADLAAGVVYKPGSNYTGPDVLDLAILDTTDQAQGATAAVPITVTPLPPAISVPTAVSVNENSSVTFSGGSAVSVTDTADGGNNDQTLTLTVGNGALSLPTSVGLTVTGNGTDSLTLSGPLSAFNADLPGLIDTPTTGSHVSETLTLSDQDLVDTLTGTNSVPITVNPLPVVNGPATASVIENGSLTFSTAATNAFSVTDAAGNGNDAVTLTVSASNGTAALAAPSGLKVAGSGTAAAPLTLSGSLALLNADLAAGLIFKPNANYSGPDVVDLAILDTSDQAQGSTATLLVTVSPLPPTITTPAPLNVNQNATLTLSGATAISVNDLGGTTEQWTASVLDGTLNVGASTGLTITGNGTASVVLTGGLTALNTELAGLVYTPTSGFNGTETLSVSDKDLADNLMGTGSVTITVNALPPTVSAPASASLNQNATLPLTGLEEISVADRSGTAEKLTLSVLEGALNVATTTGLTVTGNATAVVSLSGPLSALDTDLASATYTPTSGYNGRDTLSLSDTDTVDGLVGTGSVAITVNALPPTISAPTTISVDENSSIALTAGKLISVGDLSGTAEQLTLSVLHGSFNFGMTAGLTVSGNNTASVTLSGPLADLNADLASLTDTPTTGYNGPDTLSLANKDTADSLAASASVPITVNPLPPTVNAPPAVSVNQNGSVTFSGPNTLSVTDTAGGGNENQTLLLSVGNGTLSLPTSAGLMVTGNGTPSLTLSGPLSALNTDLVSLVYAPTSGSQSPDTLSLSDENTVDTLTGNNSVAITVNPLPLVNGPASASANENGAVTFSTANGNPISVTDAAGSGNNTVTLTLEVSNGTLVLTAPTDVKASGTGTAGSPLIVTGNVTILNADLAAGLAYKPTTGYSGADVLGLMILDTTDGAQGPVDAISITVNPLPAVSVPAAITVSTTKTFDFVGGQQLAVVDPANSGSDTVTVTLVVNDGTLALNTTSNLTFLSGNGTPTNPLVFTGTVSDVNADLADGLVYTPDSGFTGNDTLSVSIFDETDQAQGLSAQVPITVTA